MYWKRNIIVFLSTSYCSGEDEFSKKNIENEIEGKYLNTPSTDSFAV
jgi:hypothetical protein